MRTNKRGLRGTADEVLHGADVLVGVSGPGAVSAAAVRRMAPARSCSRWPTRCPRSTPEEVRDDVAIIATGRSDYPNQINNVLAFPGVFRGALEVRARTINEEMKLAAAHAIARVIPEDELDTDYIIPSVFNRHVAEAVAHAVADAAVTSGVARRERGARADEPAAPLEQMRWAHSRPGPRSLRAHPDERGGRPKPTRSETRLTTLAHTQQERLLKRLQQARGQPVALTEPWRPGSTSLPLS